LRGCAANKTGCAAGKTKCTAGKTKCAEGDDAKPRPGQPKFFHAANHFHPHEKAG
jgi:hypothetical protein